LNPITTGTNLTSPNSRFVGLAPYLRQNLAGIDLLPIAQSIKACLEKFPDDANQWLNLATVMFCLGHHEMGLAIQTQALKLQRIYYLAAALQPAKFRLLLIMVADDLAGNTPIDCLLENSDIDLIYYYVTEGDPLRLPIPDHDALMVAMSESDQNLQLLSVLSAALAKWPKPVINAPQNIPQAERRAASLLLQNVPGLLIPQTFKISRGELLELAKSGNIPQNQFPECVFPIILRPVGSHAGRGLERINAAWEIAAYLAGQTAEVFFLANFINYSNADGLFRKYRVALVNGKAFACHMAISSHWMIHYVNAGMYEDPEKRLEEAAFMENFQTFAQHHQVALEAIHQRSGLDYVCMDCAETTDGQLLIFEIDHAMIVHAMDPVAAFPYKQQHIQKLQDAFREYLFSL
jgi:glutathione synthase/RimK-type ligase-like ATP-grasp enzyme